MLAKKEAEVKDLPRDDVRGLLWLIILDSRVFILDSILHRH
jgi:hypothetical protein